PADYTVDPALLRDTLHFIGTGGDDTFTLDESNGSPVPTNAGAIFSGSAGNDIIRVLGTPTAAAAAFHAGVASVGGNFSYDRVEGITFEGAGGDDAVSVDG